MNWLKNILKKNRITDNLLGLYFLKNNFLKNKGWMESRYLFQPMNKKKKPIPWFTYSSIHFLNQKINNSMSVFEFGSGNSTIWFASKVKEVVSIEHDSKYFSEVKNKLLSFSNVDYRLAKLGKDYHQQVLNFNNKFDIIIIDGRERVQCAINCIQALKEDGVIIWDNSDRIEYIEGYDFLKDQGFKKIDFIGLGPISHSESQTTLFYRTENCFSI